MTGLAFFLRVYRLADNNIWWDEGWTIWLSQHDLSWIALRTASDEHPPLHYWLMHFWNLVVGGDAAALAPTQVEAFAGRFVSVFFGLLTVALLYRIGRKIGGNALGLVAALLLTLARFHVWWSQDIKNYTLSGFFALASVWFVLALVSKDATKAQSHKGFRVPFFASWRLRGKSIWLWLGYVLSITVALYSHYLAALIFLADNLFVLMVLLREWREGRAATSEQREALWEVANTSMSATASDQRESPWEVAPTVEWVIAQVAVLALYTPMARAVLAERGDLERGAGVRFRSVPETRGNRFRAGCNDIH